MIDDKQVTKNDIFYGRICVIFNPSSTDKTTSGLPEVMGGSGHIHGRADVTIAKGRCDGKMTFEMTGNKNIM